MNPVKLVWMSGKFINMSKISIKDEFVNNIVVKNQKKSCLGVISSPKMNYLVYR